MLTAYADESGHASDAGCQFLGIAAAIAPSDAWLVFEEQWRDILAQFSIPVLHMREFAHMTGPFQNWEEERRRALLQQLLEVVDHLSPTLVGAVMPLAPWRALDPDDEKLFIDPFFPCFQECAQMVAIHGATVGQDDVSFVFSQNDEFAAKVEQLWKVLLGLPETPPVLVSFRFGDMRSEPPLQLADLVTYEMVLGHRQVAEGTTRLRHPLAKLRKLDGFFKYIDAVYLRAQVEAAKSVQQEEGADESG